MQYSPPGMHHFCITARFAICYPAYTTVIWQRLQCFNVAFEQFIVLLCVVSPYSKNFVADWGLCGFPSGFSGFPPPQPNDMQTSLTAYSKLHLGVY